MLISLETRAPENQRVLRSLRMRIKEAQILLWVGLYFPVLVFNGHNGELCCDVFFLCGSDNLNGAQVLGRIIRVDHVDKYKKKEEEDEETERQKREARGVCRAFQRGNCTRGASCKFSHDEQVR